MSEIVCLSGVELLTEYSRERFRLTFAQRLKPMLPGARDAWRSSRPMKPYHVWSEKRPPSTCPRSSRRHFSMRCESVETTLDTASRTGAGHDVTSLEGPSDYNT